MPVIATAAKGIGSGTDNDRVTDQEPLGLHSRIALSTSIVSCWLSSADSKNQSDYKSVNGSKMMPYSGQHDLCSRNARSLMHPALWIERDETRVTPPLELPPILNMVAGPAGHIF